VSNLSAESFSDAQVVLFPNPSGGEFAISGLLQGNYKAVLLDISGKMMESLAFIIASENNTSVIVKSGLPSGIYTLMLQNTSGEKSSHRLVFQK
jgi:hypothetical protein